MSGVVADQPARWWGRPFAETRWYLEYLRLWADPVFLPAAGVPRGDGRAVVMLPGFLAGDQTLGVLGSWLWRIGYKPRVTGFVANVDCSLRGFERIIDRVDSAAQSSGRRVALVGHSRGGHFARAVAAARPDLVSHAVSLGADLHGMFGISVPTQSAVHLVRGAVLRTGRAADPACLTYGCPCAFGVAYSAPFPVEKVRLTSVYSQGDGVVDWRGAVVPEASCVEVAGSHVGMVFNRKAYRAIATALAEPELSPPDLRSRPRGESA